MFRSSSARTRSATPFTISAPSWAGSICTRNGRVPKGISTIFTMAFATSNTSASGVAVHSKPFMICFVRLAVGPDSYSFKRALSSGDPAEFSSLRPRTKPSWRVVGQLEVGVTADLPLLILLEPFEIRKINQTQLFCPVRLPIQSPGCRSHRLAKPHVTGIGVLSWMPGH